MKHSKALSVPLITAAVLLTSTLLVAKKDQPPPEIAVPKNAKDLAHKELKFEKKVKKHLNASFLDKVQSAAFVINAKVIGVEYGQMTHADGVKTPITYVVFEVLESVKGTFDTDQVVLAFTQGPVENSPDEFQLTEGIPIFSIGDEVIAFLDHNGDNLNAIRDSGVLFVHNNSIFVPEGNPLVVNSNDAIAYGKKEKISSIFTRDLNFNGHKLEIHSSEIEEAVNEDHYQKINKTKFLKLIAAGDRSQDKTFLSSRLNGFEKIDTNGTMIDVAPRETMP
ncbi:MAG: hypothetical protein M3Q07_19345 [Pseudobdellovibrionaceae bacterium]|nr:hypothetical protein [Pseudobdellovibrionaceae bacterium]